MYSKQNNHKSQLESTVRMQETQASITYVSFRKRAQLYFEGSGMINMSFALSTSLHKLLVLIVNESHACPPSPTHVIITPLLSTALQSSLGVAMPDGSDREGDPNS